ANCIRRGSRDCPTWPNCCPSEVFPSGLKNCVWLKILNNSARKSTRLVSDSEMVFRIAKSVLLTWGPQQIVRLALPRVPNSDGSKHPNAAPALHGGCELSEAFSVKLFGSKK